MLRIIVYKDRKKEWRWRIKSRNGRILADSGEGYKRRISCKLALQMMVLSIKYGEFTQEYPK